MERRQPLWVLLALGALAGCSDPPPPAQADAAATDAGVDATGNDGATPDADASAPADDGTVVAADAPDAATPDVPTDQTPPDAPPDGPPPTVELRGDFVAGAVEGAAGAITLRGSFRWQAAISGTAEGITLDGVLR